MSKDAIDDGESAEISFNAGSKARKRNLRVVDNDNDEAEVHGVDLCDVSKVTLFRNREAGATRAETE